MDARGTLATPERLARAAFSDGTNGVNWQFDQAGIFVIPTPLSQW